MRHRVYFTSDAHLGSAYHTAPQEVERRLVRWLEYVRQDARAIYFLGDVFDYWFEYRYVVPRGYVRFLGKLAELSDEGVEIHFFIGNHDVWFQDYLVQEFGAKIHYQSKKIYLDGKCFRLAHGDEEYCDESWYHKFIFCLFRNKFARYLYAALHPRWTVGLAMSWSLYSRRKGLKRKQRKDYSTKPNAYFSIENEVLVRKTKTYLSSMPEVDFFLYGHRHLLLDLSLRGQKRILILGDWLSYNSYAVWDGSSLVLEQFELEE